MVELLIQLESILYVFWGNIFPSASDFLTNNGFGVLILSTLISGIIIDLLIEVFHIKD